MTLSPTLRARLSNYAASEFVVADRVELSLVGCADREGRKFHMREWCRGNCASGCRQRWVGADAVAFEFEDKTDALLFYTNWV